jgi:hypothetical protein
MDAGELAAEFIRPLAFWAGSKPPVPPPEILKAAAALADRCQALQRMLVRGHIVAVGTFAQAGIVSPVHRMQWQRSGMTIEVRNGDLCESEKDRPAVRWSGIMLELPLTSSAAPSTEVPGAGTSAESTVVTVSPLRKKKTAGRESIIEALQALWPEGPPRGLQLQQRDAQIIDWQRKNKRTVVSTKSIRRHLSAEGVLK